MESSFDTEKTEKERKEYMSPATEVIRYSEEDIILTSAGTSST